VAAFELGVALADLRDAVTIRDRDHAVAL
jgi:hypothetical protein